MLTFNLKKEWYEKIERGEKTIEYREVKPYWTKRIANINDGDAIFKFVRYGYDDIRFRRWKSNLKIHEHCHCDEKTLRAIWNAMDEEDK